MKMIQVRTSSRCSILIAEYRRRRRDPRARPRATRRGRAPPPRERPRAGRRARNDVELDPDDDAAYELVIAVAYSEPDDGAEIAAALASFA
jgi:hypothetical protein